MNRFVKIMFVLLCTSFLCNCEKEEIVEKNETFLISLKNTEEYIHDFKISGDEDGATIKVQAKHFSISKIIRNESTNWSVFYHYKPETGFIGSDLVEIETNTGSDGSGNGKTNIVKLFFQITD